MRHMIRHSWSCAAVCSAVWLGVAHAAPGSEQKTFASADDAVSALVAAARANDVAALQAILGPGSGKLISSGDRYADQQQQSRFVAAYEERHALEQNGHDRMTLDVGRNDWPMPIPIIESSGRWHFDTPAGAQEIINRRIGRNELAAIRVSLAYVDAQRDYFERMKQETGTGYYAERLVSSPGRHDGLYWPASAGEAESPLSPLVATAIEEGYPGELVKGKPIPYQGYYFRILQAQGPDAPEGATSYMQSGRMTGGFALIAWPASYGSSGIMSFEVNQDGVVFQKDLGPKTAEIAARTTRFDPDLSWARIDVTGQ